MRIHVFALVMLAACAAPPAAEPPKGWTPGAPPELLALVPPDLRYIRIDIPPEQNAFTPWSRAVAAFTDVKGSPELEAAWDRLTDGGPFPGGEDGRLLSAWLDRNREALALWVEGSRNARCQFPPMLEGLRSELPYLAPIKKMAEATSLRAKRSAAAGDNESAANDLLATLRCGDLAVNGEGCLICSLVGLAIQQTALDGLRWLAVQPMVPRKVLEDILARVEPDPRASEGLALAWRVELCSCNLQAIENPEITLAESSRTIAPTTKNELAPGEAAWSMMIGKAAAQADKESVVELFCLFFRRYVFIATLPWKMRDRFVKRDMETVFAGVSNAMKSNAKIGVWQRPLPEDKILFYFIMPAGAETAKISERRCLAYREAVRAIVAIRLFADRRGRLPDSLDDLVTEGILPAVPMDPFNDQPLRYSKERKVVWSVGADEVDDGGAIDPELSTQSKDYAWPVP